MPPKVNNPTASNVNVLGSGTGVTTRSVANPRLLVRPLADSVRREITRGQDGKFWAQKIPRPLTRE
jgi:hypothetical protein